MTSFLNVDLYMLIIFSGGRTHVVERTLVSCNTAGVCSDVTQESTHSHGAAA